MLITGAQANWPYNYWVSQKTEYWAFGQQLTSTTEFGLEWLHSIGLRSIAFGVRFLLES